MSRRNSNSQYLTNSRNSTTTSNSFNPPLPTQSKTPLPAILSHPNEQFDDLLKSHSSATKHNNSIKDDTDLVLPTKVFKAKKTSVNDLTQAACTFLWFRRIREIFLVMGKQNEAFSHFDMKLARTDMIQTCEQYLESERPKVNTTELNKTQQEKLDRWKHKRLYAETFRMSYFRKETDIDEKISVETFGSSEHFEGEIPHFNNAIWWYSCNEAPIFDQMNNILRLENFELLMCHRYYISDLCQMIERSYIQTKVSQKFVVYRADKLSMIDFNTIEQSKQQKDAIITINGFISTSRNEKISLEYAAAKFKKRNNDVIILYEITVDPAITCSSYADIQSISFHPREEEVLFNMGSTFQINDIVNDSENPEIKRIKLTARDYNLTLLDEMKAKVKQSSPAALSMLLVRYLIELGEDRVSKRYLSKILDSKQLENDPSLVTAYNCLGTIHFRQALYGEALNNYRKALDTQARLQFSNHNALAEIFNNIGQTYLGLGQLDEAQQNLEEGIRIQKLEGKYSQQHLTSLYCNLGQVAYSREDYDEAEKHFQFAYDLHKRNTKITHDALEKRLLKADLCIAFGHLKSVQNRKDPTEANEKFSEALQIYESTLPESHPKVAETHIDIVCEYAKNKNFQSVLNYQTEHFQDLLKDYELKQTTSQQDLANLYSIIGACFVYENQFDRAMEYWQKSFEHELKIFLDQLLSSARVVKVQLPSKLVENAYRLAFEYYRKQNEKCHEHLAILFYKSYSYKEVIDLLRGKTSYLLAYTCILQENFKGCFTVYKRIQATGNYDLTLLIGILLRLLSTKKSISNPDETITELVKIEKLLELKSMDNDAIRLRMLINDSLAETYIHSNKHDEALQRLRISYELKQRHYSSYHPSLIRNFQLNGLCFYQKQDYRNSLQFYEKSIEIQLDNMPNRHIDIRSNYFLMGDCYCQMNKLELANECYDRAQATDDEDEIERDIKALIRMHTNLAQLFYKQKDVSSARTHQQDKIDLLKEIIPKFIIEFLENKHVPLKFDELQTKLFHRLGLRNGIEFSRVLHNFVFINISLARALLNADQKTDNDKDATDLYEEAIELEQKLTIFDSTGGECLTMYYKELSNAYEQMYSSMKDTIIEYLEKTLDGMKNINQKRSVQCRLGNHNFEQKNYSEANEYWQDALKNTNESQIVMRTIIEKLIEKNKENLSKSNDSDDDADDESSDDETTDENDISQRRQSTKSVDEKEKTDEFIRAYLQLEDNQYALKYLKKSITKLEDTLKPSWANIDIDEERINMMKYYYSLFIEHMKLNELSSLNPKDISNKIDWMNLLQMYTQMYDISKESNDFIEHISKAIVNIYYIAEKLFDIPEYLIKIFEILFQKNSDELSWKDFENLLTNHELHHMLMRFASYYVSEEKYSDALNIYLYLQNNIQNNDILKSAVNYNMLQLLKLHILADEEHRMNVKTIDIHSTIIPIFDRILLCRLIICFWEEMEYENEVISFENQLFDLEKETWPIDNFETLESIGHCLVLFGDTAFTYIYWNELQNLYCEILPESILNIFYIKNSTFEHIFRNVKEMNDELLTNIFTLIQSYELLAIYEEDDACELYEKAIVILNKIPSGHEQIQRLNEKIAKLKIKK